MSFADQLQAAKGDLTARRVAAVLGNSPRTVENWLAGRNTPGTIVQAAALAALRKPKRPRWRHIPLAPDPLEAERERSAMTPTETPDCNRSAMASFAAPSGYASLPPVLDACCSTRMMWFDKQDSRALYVDRREGTRIIDVGTPGTIGRTPKTVAPDMMVDFRTLPFPDESFWHVVFDPPHFHKGAGATGRIAFDFGLLDATWRDDLRAGFAECFRVLKPMGTLIFKWCEAEIPLREVLALTPERPLYGHRSGKKAQTHWCAFLKHNKPS